LFTKMIEILNLISRIVPIFFLLGIGGLIKKKGIMSDDSIENLKKLVVNFALPSVLFLTFLKLELKLSHIVIVLVMIVLNIFLLFYGKILQRRIFKKHEYFTFLIPGFEYGMLGWSLFSGAYGIQNAGSIAIIDLGHELFIWLLFVPLMIRKRDGISDMKSTFSMFVRSPVLIGIFLGLIFNLLNLKEFFFDYWLGISITTTLDYLGALTIPIMLIIIGYGVKVKKESLKDLMTLILARMAVIIPVFLVLGYWLFLNVLKLSPIYIHALFTLLILPPPFIVPIFMKRKDVESTYVNNMLTSYTLVSIIIFAVYFVLTGSNYV